MYLNKETFILKPMCTKEQTDTQFTHSSLVFSLFWSYAYRYLSLLTLTLKYFTEGQGARCPLCFMSSDVSIQFTAIIEPDEK